MSISWLVVGGKGNQIAKIKKQNDKAKCKNLTAD